MKTALALLAAFLLTIALAAVVLPGLGEVKPAPVVPVGVASAPAAPAPGGDLFLARWETLDGLLVEHAVARRALEPAALWLARAGESLAAAKAERPPWTEAVLELAAAPPSTPSLVFSWCDSDGARVEVRLRVGARARPEAVALEAWTVGAEIAQLFGLRAEAATEAATAAEGPR